MSSAAKRGFLSLNFTNRCNLRCAYCLKGEIYGTAKRHDELDVAAWRSFLLMLNEWHPHPFEIDITGGEPLLRRDVYELIAVCKSLGHRVSLCSSGALINERVAENIAQSGLDAIGISLDSLSPLVHDELRGKIGTTELAIQAIERLHKAAPMLSIGLHTVISRKSLSGLGDVLAWADASSSLRFVYLQAVAEPLESGAGLGWQFAPRFATLWPDPERVHAFLEQVIKVKLSGEPSKIGNPIAQLRLFQAYFKDPLGFAVHVDATVKQFALHVEDNGDLRIFHGRGGRIGNIATSDPEILRTSIAQADYSISGDELRGARHILLNCFPDRQPLELNELTQRAHALLPPETTVQDVKPTLDLKFCTVHIENRCPAACKMCFYWKERESRYALEDKHWENLLKDLSRLVERPFQIQLSGGEPLLNPAIYDIIAAGNAHGFLMSFPTSGMPFNDKTIARIAAAKPFTVSVSIDSIDGAIHDRLRGKPGLLNKALDGIKRLKDSNPAIHIDLLCTIMGANIEGLGDLLDYAEQTEEIHQLYLQTVAQPFLEAPYDPLWFQRPEHADLWPSNPVARKRAFSAVYEAKARSSKLSNSLRQLQYFERYYENPRQYVADRECSVGEFSVSIGLDGSLFLCQFLPGYKLGNITTDSLYDLWYSAKAQGIRRDMAKCQEHCQFFLNCYFS